MTIAGSDCRPLSLENLRGPLLIAMMVYSLGFVGAGVILWQGEIGIPSARRLEPLSLSRVAAGDAGGALLRAGDP